MQILIIFHVLIAVALIGFILIQRGQGATAGAAFGSGASGTVFGARGAGNFLTRSTWVLAGLFCALSLTMAVMASRMNNEPETDLGVIGAAQPAAEIADDIPFTEQSVTSDEPVLTDMPEVDSAIEPALDQVEEEAGTEDGDS
jgi:preprotein translocase subunit SecG